MTSAAPALSPATAGGATKSALIKGAGWAGLSEIVIRVTRIVTAVALARAMSVEEFGIAALALTVHELTRMFIQNGLGTRIVTADVRELAEVTTAVYWMNWGLGVLLFAVQVLIAGPVAAWFGAPSLFPALAALASVHVIYPLSMVQVYLAQRDNRWHVVSGATALQSAADNIAMAVMAFGGFGIWSVVVPKIVIAVGWTVFHLRATPWHRTGAFDPAVARRLMGFAAGVLGVEMLATLRAHGDKFAIGALLGTGPLGMYAFAANIGNGITTSLSQALGSVVLPFLRTGRENGALRSSYLTTLTLMLGMTVPFVLLQAAFASWYVPVVFGDKWVPAVPILVLLSVASLARPILVATSQLLRATGHARADLNIGIVVTSLFFAGLIIGLQWDGLFAGAFGSSLGLLIGALISLALGLEHSRSESLSVHPIVNEETVSETMTQPDVSVVVACYNAAATIAGTLESVAQQTYRNWEVIVVDDGSSDTSVALVSAIADRDPRVRLICQPNSGPSAARNRGVAAAGGRYVAFLDADDLWTPGHLARAVAALDADAAQGISFGAAEIMGPSGERGLGATRIWRTPVTLADVLASNPTATCSSLVVRKEVFATAGILRTDMRYAEDQEWLFRVLKAGWTIRGLDGHTVLYRTSAGGLSSQIENMRQGWLTFVALAAEQDPETVHRHLPRATAHMELYFAQRAIRARRAPETARGYVRAAITAWPAILITSPRRALGTLAASLAPDLALKCHHLVSRERHA